MRLDLLIATHNRSALLRRTLASVLAARMPAGMVRRVLVVDNNSRDDTRAAVEEFSPAFAGLLGYLHEPTTGKSHALNAGIAATNGEVVAMVDDDEEVDPGWFEEIARALADPSLDYITGPYVPRWEVAPPAWLLELGPSAVVGWVDGGPEVRTVGVDYDGIMMGGNAVVRRSVLLKAGPYDPALGPTASSRLGSGEDDDMQRRLHEIGARGQYRPGLVIYHHIPAARMTRDYHRQWFRRHGVSMGLLARAPQTRREPLPYLLGVPRHRIGRLARDLLWSVPGLLGAGPLANPSARFRAYLHAVDLAGYWRGLYFARSTR
jgi:glycosyltransferase involved in cell wall biosynthesis